MGAGHGHHHAAERSEDGARLRLVLLVTVAVGLLTNAVSLGILSRRKGASLNMRGAYLEVLSDLLGSVAVVAAAVVVLARRRALGTSTSTRSAPT